LALVKQQLADPTQALIHVAGGTGDHGRGLQMMKARNAGEAKWAKAQARNHKDQRVKEQHKTKVAYKHNSQKREFDLYLVITLLLMSQTSETLCVSHRV
jgi:pre-60S factor REI1